MKSILGCEVGRVGAGVYRTWPRRRKLQAENLQPGPLGVGWREEVGSQAVLKKPELPLQVLI